MAMNIYTFEFLKKNGQSFIQGRIQVSAESAPAPPFDS